MCSTTQSFKKSTPRLLMAVSISGAVGNSLLRVQYITAPSSKSTRPHRSSGSAVVDLKTPEARRREHKAVRRPPAEYARTVPAALGAPGASPDYLGAHSEPIADRKR